MSGTALVIVLSMLGLAITIYFAIWSKIGIIKASKKGFGELQGSMSKLVSDVNDRMKELVEIIKVYALKGDGTIRYELEKLGEIKISVADIKHDSIDYLVQSIKRPFRSGLLANCIKQSQSLANKRRELFGDQKVKARSFLPNRIELYLPSSDKEICAQFIAFFVNWLDTEYYAALQGIDEAEKQIERHLQEPTSQDSST